MSSGIWLRCPCCRRSIQIYPGESRGYFQARKRTDVCASCGAPMRMMDDGSLAIGSWDEWEFRNRGLGKLTVVRIDCDEESSSMPTQCAS